MEENPNYWGILPADVRYSKNLRPSEKVLFTELSALTNDKGYCWASNGYFAKLYGVGKQTVSLWFSHLQKEGFIRIEVISGNQTMRRVYVIKEIPLLKKEDTPITKDEVNSTSINNKKKTNTSPLTTAKAVVQKELTPEQKAEAKQIELVLYAFTKVNPITKLRYMYKTWRSAAVELMVACGGQDEAIKFIEDFVKYRDTTNDPWLAAIDTPYQMANKYASLRQNMNKIKKDGYNLKGSGYKYQEPIVITNNKST